MTSAIGKAKLLHVLPDMLLPEGKTCKECVRFQSCSTFLGEKIDDWEACDWSPSWFREKEVPK